MRIIFFGSDDFAKTNLEKLLHSTHEVAAIVTQPDKAKGRGLKIGMCPIKELAGKHNIQVLQPADLNEEYLIEEMRAYQADLFVVIAYGKILPKGLLDIPKVCAINVHASLLPKYRGAAPVNWAIINGDKETGVSVIKLNSVMDGGDIILQKKTLIESSDTAITLKAKLARLGADCLIKSIDILKGTEQPLMNQDETKVSYAKKLTKGQGLIKWENSAVQIHNMIRGLLPWPSAYTFYKGKLLKILKAEVITRTLADKSAPATIVEVNKEGLVVATGEGYLLVTKVHPEASRPMDVKDFVAGHKVNPGERFAEGT